MPEPVQKVLIIDSPLYTSCVRWVHYLEPKAPLIDATWYQTLPHSSPAVGRIAVFDYHGIGHVAFIAKLEDTGFWVSEANYSKAKQDERFILWDDPAIVSFWSPSGTQ